MFPPRLLPAMTAAVLTAALFPGIAPAADGLSVRVVRQGLFEGYPAGTRNQDGKPVYFESSAVATDGTFVWFTGDKPAPSTKLSSVVRFPLADLDRHALVPWSGATPLMAPEFRHTQKIESTAVTTDGRRFAATAFDRYLADSKVTDPYNIVVTWQGEAIDRAMVMNASTRDGETSSSSLRSPILKALRDTDWPDGPAYIKIEGLAALPDHRLWFGVRESGKDGRKPENFRYRFTVLEARWELREGQPFIVPEFRRVLDATAAQLAAAGITGTVGLSSLEYDPLRGIVWAVASWEEPETETVPEDKTKNGSWLLAIAGCEEGGNPALAPVHGADGKAVSFTHKVEGLCLAGSDRMILVSDEDRRPTVVATPEGPKTREPHMGVWTTLEIVK